MKTGTSIPEEETGYSPEKGVPSASGSSVKANVKAVENMLQEGQQLIREYKKEIEFLRQEILNMEQRLSALNNENQSSLTPIIHSNFD